MNAKLDGMVERHEAQARAWEQRLSKRDAALEVRTAAVQVRFLCCNSCLWGIEDESLPLPS